MKKYFISILAGLFIAGAVTAANYTVKNKDKNDTKKIIEKVETVTRVVEISIEEEINAMNNDKADIEAILNRFNSHKDRFNEAITADPNTKLKTLDAATCTFPTIPEVAEEEAISTEPI